MANIKAVIIRSKTNDQGQSPVKIQINHNYRTARVTLFWIEPKYFNKGRVTKPQTICEAQQHDQPRIGKIRKKIRMNCKEKERHTRFMIFRDKDSTDAFATDVLEAFRKRQKIPKQKNPDIQKHPGPGKQINSIPK